MQELFHFEWYELTMAAVGLAILVAAWIPQVFTRRHLTVAIIPLLAGFLIFQFTASPLPSPMNEDGRWLWEKVTEFVVIVSLFGAGLKIERDLDFPYWRATLRLLLITMPLSIGLTAFLGWYFLAMAPATALLLGAVLAPTDPVLAGDVQVGPPSVDLEEVEKKGPPSLIGKKEGMGKEEENIRFTLTTEAGLNDGLAFPFTYLAVAVATLGLGTWRDWIGTWLLQDVLFRIPVGVAVGALVGWIMMKIIFVYPKDRPLSKEGLGSLAICVLFISYGVAEIVGGYGFLSVFAAAYLLRRLTRTHHYNLVLYDFSENLERVLMSLVLLLVGGLIAEALPFITWEIVAISALITFVVRYATGMLGQLGGNWPRWEKGVIAFFGVRGMGSIYYLTYAMGLAAFTDLRPLMATVLCCILLSSLVHGLSAYPFMQWLERQKKNEMAAEDPAESGTKSAAAA